MFKALFHRKVTLWLARLSLTERVPGCNPHRGPQACAPCGCQVKLFALDQQVHQLSCGGLGIKTLPEAYYKTSSSSVDHRYTKANVIWQGEREEAQELQRLHLRLERANEHVSQLQTRLANIASPESKAAHQLAQAQQAQHAQPLEVESLQQQLADSQASNRSNADAAQLLSQAQQAQHAQQIQIAFLQEQLAACQLADRSNDGSISNATTSTTSATQEAEIEALQSEVAQLHGIIAQQRTRQLSAADATEDGAAVLSEASTSGRCSESSLSHDSLATEWQQLAVQDGAAFCDCMRNFQLEYQQLQEAASAHIADQSQQCQQQSRLAETESSLAERQEALASATEQLTGLQTDLADKVSVVRLQEEQLSVLQSEVNQLTASSNAASACTAGKDATIQTLQQQVADLQSQLQQHDAHASACTAGHEDKVQTLQREVADLQARLQQRDTALASAVARADEHQQAAREAFHQASTHARSAQQAQSRCDVLEQAVRKAERRVEVVGCLQQVCSLMYFLHQHLSASLDVLQKHPKLFMLDR